VISPFMRCTSVARRQASESLAPSTMTRICERWVCGLCDSLTVRPRMPMVLTSSQEPILERRSIIALSDSDFLLANEVPYLTRLRRREILLYSHSRRITKFVKGTLYKQHGSGTPPLRKVPEPRFSMVYHDPLESIAFSSTGTCGTLVVPKESPVRGVSAHKKVQVLHEVL
jgi:hypothetical protein